MLKALTKLAVAGFGAVGACAPPVKLLSSTINDGSVPAVPKVGASSRKPTLTPRSMLVETLSVSLSVTVAVNVTAPAAMLMSSFGEAVPPVGWVMART